MPSNVSEFIQVLLCQVNSKTKEIPRAPCHQHITSEMRRLAEQMLNQAKKKRRGPSAVLQRKKVIFQSIDQEGWQWNSGHRNYTSASSEVGWIIISHEHGYRSDVCRSSCFHSFNQRTARVFISLTHRTIRKKQEPISPDNLTIPTTLMIRRRMTMPARNYQVNNPVQRMVIGSVVLLLRWEAETGGDQ